MAMANCSVGKSTVLPVTISIPSAKIAQLLSQSSGCSNSGNKAAHKKQEAVQGHCGCDHSSHHLVWRTKVTPLKNLETITPPHGETMTPLENLETPPPNHGTYICPPPCCVKPLKCDSSGAGMGWASMGTMRTPRATPSGLN